MHAQLYVVVNNDCMPVLDIWSTWHIILFLHILLFPLVLKGSIPDAPADVTNGVTGSGSDKSKVSLCIWEYKIAGIRMEVHVSNLFCNPSSFWLAA